MRRSQKSSKNNEPFTKHEAICGESAVVIKQARDAILLLNLLKKNRKVKRELDDLDYLD